MVKTVTGRNHTSSNQLPLGIWALLKGGMVLTVKRKVSQPKISQESSTPGFDQEKLG